MFACLTLFVSCSGRSFFELFFCNARNFCGTCCRCSYISFFKTPLLHANIAIICCHFQRTARESQQKKKDSIMQKSYIFLGLLLSYAVILFKMCLSKSANYLAIFSFLQKKGVE